MDFRRFSSLFACAIVIWHSAVAADPSPGRVGERLAAQRVLADKALDDVLNRARALLKAGFNAGSGYGEIWIRDWATFMDLSCEVNDAAKIRDGLLLILNFQGPDGNIPDGVSHVDEPPEVPKGATELTTVDAGWREIGTHPRLTDYQSFKNSVETDQESSFVLAVKSYIDHTGDRAILAEKVDGSTVLERMVKAMEFLHRDRWSEKYGLIWGATTIDWGDIAPEDDPGAVLREDSHRAIDVYDNAMFVLALDALVPMLDEPEAGKWTQVRDAVKVNSRKWLWEPERQKFRNHIYLGKSPFPADFDEEAIWYEGGTAVAILAGFLDDDEVRASLEMMRLNREAAGGRTIGITNYPTYPKGLFANDHVLPGVYQNGGDWDWFGGRMAQALAARGMGADAYLELLPMVHRVQRHDGFFEWFDMQDQPQGSGEFRGSAGVLGKAILMLQQWAREETAMANVPENEREVAEAFLQEMKTQPEHRADDVMLETFGAHREAFDRALAQAKAYPTVSRIDLRPGAVPDGPLPKEMCEEFKRLFPQMGVQTYLGHPGQGRYEFVSTARGMATGGSAKGFVWLADRPDSIVESLDESQKARRTGLFTDYRPIEGNWYLFYEFDD